MKSADDDILQRYNRNIILDNIGKDGQNKLLGAKILVCGAGGLGSTVIANLAAVGIGTIGIVDNDSVELSNLNRQYIHKYSNIGMSKVESAKTWIEEFNPNISVIAYKIRLDDSNYFEIVRNYDIIIDCFDSWNSKFLLNKIALATEKPLIHGGVSEFSGQVTTIIPNKTACLACTIPQFEQSETIGVISPIVSMIASVQSIEALKLVLDIGERLENKFLCIDALSMKVKTIGTTKNPQCNFCK